MKREDLKKLFRNRKAADLEIQYFEKDGGHALYSNVDQFKKEVTQNGPVWEKAKKASEEAFGQIKWPFVMWWYEKHGGK